jgi:uncharacterized membrane protein
MERYETQILAAAPDPARGMLRLLLLALLLLAFALRAFHLDFQSFWSDEGISWQRASLSLAVMLEQMPVEHVPGYFVLLRGWMLLAGESDFALRFFSLLPGVLAVALLARWAAALGRQTDRVWAPASTVAVVAAALAATNGFLIWYAQEARMYSWLLAAGLLAHLAFWQLVHSGARTWRLWWALYVAGLTLSVYLHFYGFLVPLAHLLWMVVWVPGSRQWRVAGRWAAAGAATVLLFLPWLPRALAIFAFTGWREPGNPAEIPARFLAAYLVGDSAGAAWRTPLAALLATLAGIGWLLWLWRRPLAGLFAGAMLWLPLGLVLALAARNPDYHERYAIVLAGPVLLLAASGVALFDLRTWRTAPAPAWVAQWAPVPPLLLGLLLAAAALPALQRIYFDPAVQKPDFRGAAARMMAGEQPGDVILIDGPDPEKVFNKYYRGPSPVVDLRSLEGAANDAVDTLLRDATAGKLRAWELLFFHPPGPVQVWTATQAWATEATDHNGIRVTLYGLAAGDAVTRTLDLAFGPELTLRQVDLSAAAPAPGELLRVSTHWFVHAPAPDYKFSLRLHDSAGALLQTVDYVPQNWFAPTNVWLVERDATDQRGLLLPSELPPGDYRLTLRLYRPGDGSAVDTAAGQDVELARWQVGP